MRGPPSIMAADTESNGSKPHEIQDFSNAIAAHGYREGMDYDEGQELVVLHHNLYHMTFEAKLRVFVLLFTIIVVPATIVFVICYVRDRRKQRQYKKQVAALLQDSAVDLSLPYSARLSRPVPGSVSTEFPRSPELPQSGYETKERKVSFADKVTGNDNPRRSTVSSVSRRPMLLPEALVEMEDDVFSEDESHTIILPKETDTGHRPYVRETTGHKHNENNAKTASVTLDYDANSNSVSDNEKRFFCPGNIPVCERGTAGL